MSVCTSCGGSILYDSFNTQIGGSCTCTNQGLVIQENNEVLSENPTNCCVESVNDQAGNVLLTTDNIGQGSTNLYMTDAGVRGALSAESPIALDPDSGVISHKGSGVVADTYGSETKFVSVIINESGHITEITEHDLPSIEIPENLQVINDLSGIGFLVRTNNSTNSWRFSLIKGTTGQIVVDPQNGATDPTIGLAEIQGLVPTTYGSGTQVPVITVDAYGRITAIDVTDLNITVNADPFSLGELTNVDDNVNSEAAVGQTIIWNGTSWGLGAVPGALATTTITKDNNWKIGYSVNGQQLNSVKIISDRTNMIMVSVNAMLYKALSDFGDDKLTITNPTCFNDLIGTIADSAAFPQAPITISVGLCVHGAFYKDEDNVSAFTNNQIATGTVTIDTDGSIYLNAYIDKDTYGAIDIGDSLFFAVPLVFQYHTTL